MKVSAPTRPVSARKRPSSSRHYASGENRPRSLCRSSLLSQKILGAPFIAASSRWVGSKPLPRVLALTLMCLPVAGSAQLIGYVATKDAEVTGASDTIEGRAVLSGSVAVTARDHTAPITLGRGGKVQVCQTSVLHLTESKAADLKAPLLLSLDRGAIEIQMISTASDAVMTPDLRFTIRAGGPLDLRLRLARNGDTCVENRGIQAPTLAVSDPFGEALYELLPNQHVLFEHGSLREVVDHETTSCGCPEPAGVSLAEAMLAPGSKARPADPHPFPTAVSEGLAPTPEVPQAAGPGIVHAQVTDTFTHNADPETPPVAVSAPVPATQPAPAPPRGPFHAIGHFFRRLFGGS